MADGAAIACEVAYARPDRQFVFALTLPAGATARDALLRAIEAGLGEQCPEIVPERAVLGVFGKVIPADHPLQEGDRVEIYRPLLADPRAARRERVDAGRKGRK